MPPILDAATDLRVPQRVRLSWGYSQVAVVLLVADALALGVAWTVAEHLSFQEPAAFVAIWQLGAGTGLFWLSWICYLLISLAAGLYRFGDDWQSIPNQVKALALTFLGVLLIAYLARIADGLPRSLFVTAWITATALVVANRSVVQRGLRFLNQRNQGVMPILLIAEAHDQAAIQEGWRSCSGYRVVATWERVETGDPQRLRALSIQEIHITEPIYHTLSGAQLWALRGLGYRVRMIPSRLRPLHPQAKLHTVAGIPTLEFSPPVLTGADFFLKRGFDFVLSLLAVVLLSPVFVSIALLVYLDDPGQVFYGGWRPGLGGIPFRMWKFRTMVKNAEQLQPHLEALNENPDGVLFKMTRDPRVTRVGYWLRRTSLDELPQLFNVLRGEMSLVGPRPLPVRDVERFQPWHHARHAVLPGITGLWQVRGRGDYVHFDEAIAYDLDYIQQWSLWLDIQLLWETVWVVLRGKGAC
ncbi:MAG: sugar transferase [Synechococcales cyanobacterium]